jgi:hypothetical protein
MERAFGRGNIGFVLIECRGFKASKQKQEKIGALAYRILDTGADGGIVVSPLGLQEGAERIANSENIISVQLSEESKRHDFVLRFLNRLMVGVENTTVCSDEVSIQLSTPRAEIVRELYRTAAFGAV